MKEATPADAKLKKSDIYELIINGAKKENKYYLETKQIYDLINLEMSKKDLFLSETGKASLRKTINKYAVKDGILYKVDNGWKLTPKALNIIEENELPDETVYNIITEKEEKQKPNAVRGKLFEDYCLELLKRIYPFYSWYHQGIHKKHERGLDLIAEKIGEINKESKTLGVQIKLHKENSSPTQEEWLKFLAGCFARKIDKAIFITTGKLTSNQRREAGEAQIIVIEGYQELNRIAKQYGMDIFKDD